MPRGGRYNEPPESQNVDLIETQMIREADDASQLPDLLTDAQKRIIKARLRLLQKEADDTNLHYTTASLTTVERQIEETNREFKKFRYGPSKPMVIKDASLAVIDSKVMSTHTDTAAKIGKLARSHANAFEVADFFDPLRELIGLERSMLEDVDEDDESAQPAVRRGGRLGDWAKIGWMAAGRSRRAPAAEFMNGMMAVEHTRRVVQRKARQQQVLQPEVRPKEIRQEDMKQAVNPTIVFTGRLEALLEKHDAKVNLFKWLINPWSFGQTIENTFYTSFLLKECKVAIDEAEDGSGIPYIFCCDPPSEEDLRAREFDDAGNDIGPALRKRQVVLEMSLEIWQEAIELFDIRESFIPHRTEEAQPGVDGWYA
ncbi:hypothetical protein NliqN6_3838 [Naganishia liquefaciens]|uniref:Non-structural maintenance of chromosomes element 4 n=1 Tax=Naganishia liquefaciens TaxID=104408 RepID=A0A8H3TTV7_9TREE|nr:hypothetical protein NliqN6_3838 [Naganishia liquefaciens]